MMRHIALAALFFMLFLIGCSQSPKIIAEDKLSSRAVTVIDDRIVDEDGSIDAYFCPRDNCSSRLVPLLQDAAETIHCAFFDLNLQEIIQALEDSAAEVKLVIDNENPKEVQHLDFVRFDTSKQYSHNKFCIIDGYTVWTGSFNPTIRGDTANDNNVIVMESSYLAQNYEDEFQELWNGNFGTGSPVKNRNILLSGTKIENYFCPEDRCAQHIIDTLSTANESIYFMAFSFTHDGIGNAIIKKHNNGIDVKGVFEKSQNNKYTEFKAMTGYNMDIVWDHNKANMHHKVFIIDKKIVITGSMNPTDSGDTKNDENVLIIHDEDIASQFLDEFWNVFGVENT